MSPSDATFDPGSPSNASPPVDFLLPLTPPPTPLPPSGFVAPEAPAAYQMRFTGSGEEYFKIWAVNLALTILTLGIFSAWAKVRRLRYFYANTMLAGSTFDFHGSPAAILRGRLIALVVLIAYTFSPRISPILYAIVAGIILVGFPWLYWRSLRFRLGNTSYRGARFSFRGDLRTAYAILLPPATLFLGLNVLLIVFGPQAGQKPDLALVAKAGFVYLLALAVAPYYYHRMRAYQHDNAYFGATKFSYSGTAGDFYKLAGKMLAMCLLPLLGLSVVCAIIFYAVGNFMPKQAALFVIFPILFLFYACVLLMIPYGSARSQNIVWGQTKVGDVQLSSTLRARSLTGVLLVNFILNACTIGLFRAFAAVRAAKVRQEAIAFDGNPAVFENVPVETGGPTGAEFGEMIGFDIAL